MLSENNPFREKGTQINIITLTFVNSAVLWIILVKYLLRLPFFICSSRKMEYNSK